MVGGLSKFKEFFKDYTDNYVLIGGAACDTIISEAGLTFRATKDLDIILVVEALTPEFVRKFWLFISEGKYELNEKGGGDKNIIGFANPEQKDFHSNLNYFPEILTWNWKGNQTYHQFRQVKMFPVFQLYC